MHDRVADVLSQRATLNSGPAPAVLVSLFLHGSAAALAIYAAMHRVPPERVQLVSIKFSSSPAAPVAAAPAPRRRTPPAPKPLETPKVQTPKIQDPKPIAEPVPATATTVPAAKNTAPPSPFGQSTKKAGPVAAPPPVAPPAAPAVGAVVPDIAVGGAGVTGIEGGDFPYTIYLDRMQALIGKNWFRPAQLAAGTEAVIYFRVNRDGTISDAKIETASSNGTFDRAALRAILATSPLPPLPYGYTGTFLGVHLKFR